jgi:hypothetical protein
LQRRNCRDANID